MHRTFKQMSLLAAAMLGAGALAAPVLARSVPATAGRANPPADATCFPFNFGTITNSCPTTRTIEFPLVMDAAGSFTGHIYAKGDNASQNVGCQANGMTNGLGVAWISWSWDSYRYLPTFGTYQSIDTTAYAPAHGAAFVTCNVDPLAILSVTEW
jgi:hypothetical protein